MYIKVYNIKTCNIVVFTICSCNSVMMGGRGEGVRDSEVIYNVNIQSR